MNLVLHGYWRSSASYRVRIGLNLKGLDYGQKTHDLRKAENRAPSYLALSTIGLVPTLETDNLKLTQSLAILEWLEETFLQPPLLPSGADARAIVRAMADIVACDIHPINNLRVLNQLRGPIEASNEAVKAWINRWIFDGFIALEAMVAEHGRGSCFGELPGLADCCLVPQLYNARRFDVDLTPFPALCAVQKRCLSIDAFARAAPELQPDADPPAP